MSTFGSVFVGLNNNFTVKDGAWTSFDKYPRQLGDVNGDGRDDIVGFGNDNVLVSLGQSDGTFGSVFVGLNNNFTVKDGAWTSFDNIHVSLVMLTAMVVMILSVLEMIMSWSL
ncbi:hypothetical protein [Nostoc sp. DSM 114167]|jgi:hypothetical protein|uniref:hypothetical protein n=1 Tax=Nostoc sp. DSM 114167 TaxID=3439050 RepID=UPI004046032C